jgi:hypothetical protein
MTFKTNAYARDLRGEVIVTLWIWDNSPQMKSFKVHARKLMKLKAAWEVRGDVRTGIPLYKCTRMARSAAEIAEGFLLF